MTSQLFNMNTTPNETPIPRWRRTPEERPRQILEAALEVFGEQGLAGARIDDIAEQAGISKGTVYLYFPSKDDLFCGVIRDTFAEAVETASSVPQTENAEADLRAFSQNYWSFLRSKRFETVYRLVNSEHQTFPALSLEYGREVREPIRQVVCGILDRGVASGVFEAGDNEVRSRMLLALLWQHGVWCARREIHPDLQHRSDSAVLNEVITFFLHAIARER
jgi:AcrR family transcriptional regulator